MDILEQAIADAKSIREAAVANAKATLEETFRPTLQRMISSRLEEEGDEDDIEMGADLDPAAAPAAPPAPEVPAAEAPVEEVPEAPAEDTPSQDDLDLEELLAELDALDQEEPAEEPVMESEDNDEDDMMKETVREKGFGPDDSGGAYDGKAGLKHTNLKSLSATKSLSETEDADADDQGGDSDPDEVDLDELFSENYKKKAPEGSKNTKAGVNEVKTLKAQLAKALQANAILRNAINETQLLNAKLVYATKISKNYKIGDALKTKILEQFDRATDVRECQLIYTTLAQSLAESKVKQTAAPAVRKPVMESVTRKGLGSSTDAFSLKDRWGVLSGIKPLTD